MMNGISGLNSYYYMSHYGSVYGNRPYAQAGKAPAASPSVAADENPAKAAATARPVAQSIPSAADTQKESGSGIWFRQGIDPVELEVRMRIRYEDPSAPELSNQKEAVSDAESAQDASEEGKCKTCEERKYKDGSNDMGVSFKTAAHIAPEQAAATVRGHEMEHVFREQAKAEREDRQVVSQSVSLHTSICPECGKPYVSGGTTRTTTAAKPEAPVAEQDTRQPFLAIA